ncbi:unnamed protein product [Linum trigynum]|uniref:CASP-like protein n=1 Tax=Linum trigynum TaxID=586398 RepID=A0AAV2EWH7_9ROSI
MLQIRWHLSYICVQAWLMAAACLFNCSASASASACGVMWYKTTVADQKGSESGFLGSLSAAVMLCMQYIVIIICSAVQGAAFDS